MTLQQHLPRRALAAAGLVLALPLLAFAQPAPDQCRDMGPGAMHPHGPGPGPGGPPPHGGMGGPFGWDGGMAGAGDFIPPLPLLRGLALTEAQRDQVFAILHAQAPQLRDKEKAARRAQDELRALVTSASYDKAKAAALAEAGAKAQGEAALLRADADHRIYLLLTDEQRRTLEARPQPPGRAR